MRNKENYLVSSSSRVTETQLSGLLRSATRNDKLQSIPKNNSTLAAGGIGLDFLEDNPYFLIQ